MSGARLVLDGVIARLDDGRVILHVDHQGAVDERELATINHAAHILAGQVEAAIRSYGAAIKSGHLDGLAITIHVKDRELTLEELAAALMHPKSYVR